MDSNVTVLVVSPKTLAAELLISAFSASPNLTLAGHATTLHEVIDAVQRLKVDVVVVDSEWGPDGLDQIDLLREIRVEGSDAKCIVLLHQQDSGQVVECFRSGARGVIFKHRSDFRLLCKCIECVHKGQIWASTQELDWVLEALETTRRQPSALRIRDARGTDLLSKREEDVVRLLMDGLSNRGIASTLHLSEHTIKNYLFRIFDKLGVSSRVELLLYAMNSMTLNDAQWRGLSREEQVDINRTGRHRSTEQSACCQIAQPVQVG